MKVWDVVVGRHYVMRQWLKPVKRYSCRYSLGFPGCWVRREVMVVERIGQHFIAESVQWKCTGRDMDSLKCTWVKLVVREHVYARDLVPNGFS